MALTVERLGVIIEGNNQNLIGQINQINNKLEQFGTVAGKTSVNGSKLGKSFNGIGLAIGGALTIATAAITKFSVASAKMAMEAVESENLVAVTFGNLTGDVVAWSNKLQESLGLNGFELRKNAALFFNISSSLGVTTDNAYKLSTGLAMLAGDLASFYNISNDEAITKLRAGIVGETEPLKQLGVIVDENTIKQTAYRVGIAQTGEELDNNQKVLARYMTIMQQTSTAQGDLARTIDSPANQARLLQSNIKYLSTTLGSLFIPILNSVLPYLNAFVKFLTMGIKSIATFFGIAGIEIKDASDNTKDGSNQLDNFGSSADNATNATKKLKKELMGLASFDEMNVLTKPDGESGAGAGGSSGTNFKLPEFPDYGEQVKNKTKEILDDMISMWEDFTSNPVVKGVGKVLLGILGVLGAFKIVNTVVGWIKSLAGVFNLFAFILGGVGNILKGVWGVVGGLGTGIVNIIKGVGTAVSTIFTPAVLAIGAFIAYIGLTVAGTVLLMKYQWEKLQRDIETAKKIFLSLRDTVKNVVLTIMPYFVNLANGILKVFSNIKTGVINFGIGIVSGIKGAINKGIEKLNGVFKPLQGVKIPLIAPNGLNIPTIPYLAEGGAVNSPTMAMIGEGGYSEAVLPLDRNTEWAEKVAGLINNKMGSEPVTLVVNVGGEKLYEKTIDFIKDKSLRTNINLMGL